MGEKDTLALWSSQLADLNFATGVSTCASLRLEQVASEEQYKKLIETSRVAVTFVDSSIESNLLSVLDLAGSNSQTPIFAFAQACQKSVEDLEKYQKISGLIFRAGEATDFSPNQNSLAKIIAHQLRILDVDELTNDNSVQFSLELKNSMDKNRILVELENMLGCFMWDPRMILPAILTADELLTNAIYSAPQDDQGRQIYASLPRSTMIPVDPRFSVTVQVSVDKNLAVLKVSDRAATLDRGVLLRHLAKAYHANQFVEEGRQGSGLGLAMILKTGASLHFEWKKDVSSTVVAIFTRRPTFKQFRNQLQFVTTNFEM